jgi:hypothetical protein
VNSAGRSERPGLARDRRYRPLPDLAQPLDVASVEARQEHLAHDLVVRGLGFAQTTKPVVGQADESGCAAMTCDEIAAIFERHGMTLLGPPLSLD